MCICLNCSQINVCQTYSIVELKHRLVTLNSINFFAQQPILVCINNSAVELDASYESEWDIAECLSFQEQPGIWLFSEVFLSVYLIYDTFLIDLTNNTKEIIK